MPTCNYCGGSGCVEFEAYEGLFDCPNCKFDVGDTVYYQGDTFTVEKDYGGGVYLIGNKDAFCDLVCGNELEYGG